MDTGMNPGTMRTPERCVLGKSSIEICNYRYIAHYFYNK